MLVHSFSPTWINCMPKYVLCVVIFIIGNVMVDCGGEAKIQTEPIRWNRKAKCCVFGCSDRNTFRIHGKFYERLKFQINSHIFGSIILKKERTKHHCSQPNRYRLFRLHFIVVMSHFLCFQDFIYLRYIFHVTRGSKTYGATSFHVV